MARSISERALLSPLMIKLLVGYANGGKLKEMAKDSFVSYSSVANTMHEAKRRLGARHLAHAVIKAQALGIISCPEDTDEKIRPLL